MATHAEPAPIERVLAELDASRLQTVIKRLAADEPPGEIGLRIDAVISAIVAGVSLGEGADAWRATIRLKRAIAAMLESIDGMRYVEGDA